jgi:hypothetical protein
MEAEVINAYEKGNLFIIEVKHELGIDRIAMPIELKFKWKARVQEYLEKRYSAPKDVPDIKGERVMFGG